VTSNDVPVLWAI